VGALKYERLLIRGLSGGNGGKECIACIDLNTVVTAGRHYIPAQKRLSAVVAIQQLQHLPAALAFDGWILVKAPNCTLGVPILRVHLVALRV
jgi:hypothetical protein